MSCLRRLPSNKKSVFVKTDTTKAKITMILAFLMYTVPFSNMEGRFVSAAAPGRCFRSCRILSHSACLRDQDLEDSYIIKDRTGGFNNHILLEGRQNRIKIYRPLSKQGGGLRTTFF